MSFFIPTSAGAGLLNFILLEAGGGGVFNGVETVSRLVVSTISYEGFGEVVWVSGRDSSVLVVVS